MDHPLRTHLNNNNNIMIKSSQNVAIICIYLIYELQFALQWSLRYGTSLLSIRLHCNCKECCTSPAMPLKRNSTPGFFCINFQTPPSAVFPHTKYNNIPKLVPLINRRLFLSSSFSPTAHLLFLEPTRQVEEKGTATEDGLHRNEQSFHESGATPRAPVPLPGVHRQSAGQC